jgi:hypothetical protein
MNAKLLILLAAGFTFVCVAETGKEMTMPGMPDDVTTMAVQGAEDQCCNDLEQECIYTHTPCIKEVGKRVQVREYAPSHCFKTQKNLCVEKVYTIEDHSRCDDVVCKNGVCKPYSCTNNLECPCVKKCAPECPKTCCPKPCAHRCHSHRCCK